MGRALQTIRTRKLEALFGYFGVEVEDGLVQANRDVIAERFAAEVQEIVRLCTGLREKERFTILREALRLAYDVGVRRGASAAHV